MRITQLTLCNFRCFGPEPKQVDLEKENLTVFIGTNGAGKTAVLQALVRLFAPRAAERRLVSADFHKAVPDPAAVPASVPDPDAKRTLWLEVRLDFPDLKASSVPMCFEQMNLDQTGVAPFCRIRLEATLTPGGAEDEIEEKLYWVGKTDALGSVGFLADDAKPMRNSERNLIQVLYVPAVRDPSKQLGQAATALLHPLLRAVAWADATRDGVKDKADKVRQEIRQEPGMQRIEQVVAESWRSLQQFPDLCDVQLQPLDPDFRALLRQMEAVFGPKATDEHHSSERLSDGLRSLFYFTLLETRFKLEEEFAKGPVLGFEADNYPLPLLTLFAIEEPENHLAPHYLGRILHVLTKFAKGAHTQVVLTSQSPAILGRIEPEGVRYVRSKTGQTSVLPLSLPDKQPDLFSYVKGAVKAYPELYFASAVVLGEGDSEALVLPRIAATLGDSLDHQLISFVPLGGRHVNYFWKLLHDLDIPHITLLDLDRGRSGGGWGRIKYAIDELMEHTGRTLADLSITQPDFDELVARALDLKDFTGLDAWLPRLEAHNVFYSNPLDLDFLMLQKFSAEYQQARPGGSGPQKPTDSDTITSATEATLKKDGDGSSYSADEKKAFVWYKYHFLGDSKPVSHFTALARIEAADKLTQENLPEVLQRLFTHLKTIQTK